MTSVWKTLVVFGLFGFGLLSCTATSVMPFGGEEKIELEDDERRLWKMAEEEQSRLDRSARLFDDAVFTDYINQVGQRLIPRTIHVRELVFRFKVIKNPLLNAFSYPNGAVYIHSGLLAKMDNEAQLATVLAHEIAHVTQRHTLQAMRNAKSAAAFFTTLQVIGAPAGLPGLGVVLLGGIGTMAAVSGYSQAAEEEADSKGFAQVLRAGYDAAESIKLFEKVKKDLEEREIEEPFFFGTHPRLQERQESYTRLVGNLPSEHSGEKGAERFVEKVLPLLLENAQMDLAMGRFTFAEDAVQKFLSQRPNSAQAHYWLAETYRQRNQQGDAKKAEREYLLAVQHDETYSDSYKGLGLIFMKRGDKKRAADYYRKYLSLVPQAKDRAYIDQYLREIQLEEGKP